MTGWPAGWQTVWQAGCSLVPQDYLIGSSSLTLIGAQVLTPIPQCEMHCRYRMVSALSMGGITTAKILKWILAWLVVSKLFSLAEMERE